ncbi:hypothetical protein JCM12298_10730 [Desulfothermus naphthae]
MITPTKHTNIKYSILYIASKILIHLKKENIIKLDDLVNLLVDELGKEVKNNINISLTFLYALDKIQYIKELDAITLINGNNEQ